MSKVEKIHVGIDGNIVSGLFLKNHVFISMFKVSFNKAIGCS